LQFPREYITIVNEEIALLYQHEDINELNLITYKLFRELEIYGLEKPKRGVGLGYYTGAMSIAMFAIMQDTGIAAAFADDMIIEDEYYEYNKSESERFGMITNVKKSGKEFYNSLFFMNVGYIIDEEDYSINYYHIDNEPLAAVTTKRHHFQRKLIISNLDFSEMDPLKAAFQAELCFGYEFYPGDYIEPVVSGGCFRVPPNVYVRTDKIFLDRNPVPQFSSEFGKVPEFIKKKGANYTIDNGSYSRYIHKFRKDRWKHRKFIDPALYKSIQYQSFDEDFSDLEVLYNSIPKWFDEKIAIENGIAFGKCTEGIEPMKLKMLSKVRSNYLSIKELVNNTVNRNIVMKFYPPGKLENTINELSKVDIINREYAGDSLIEEVNEPLYESTLEIDEDEGIDYIDNDIDIDELYENIMFEYSDEED
jgi:hypothetical protein